MAEKKLQEYADRMNDAIRVRIAEDLAAILDDLVDGLDALADQLAESEGGSGHPSLVLLIAGEIKKIRTRKFGERQEG